MHSCESCAFLDRIWQLPPTSFGSVEAGIVHGRELELNGPLVNLGCYENVYPLNRELQQRKVTESLEQALAHVMQHRRQCEFYVRARQGMGPSAHQKIRERKEQRRWTLFASLAGGAMGGIVAIVASAVAYLLGG